MAWEVHIDEVRQDPNQPANNEVTGRAVNPETNESIVFQTRGTNLTPDHVARHAGKMIAALEEGKATLPALLMKKGQVIEPIIRELTTADTVTTKEIFLRKVERLKAMKTLDNLGVTAADPKEFDDLKAELAAERAAHPEYLR